MCEGGGSTPCLETTTMDPDKDGLHTSLNNNLAR